ncbi:MAG: hypothetical protein Q8S13_12045 [Dehalococcoidia bacterium]|nr:hypothetical protein [Dehalococcoidia bacterium]
MSPKLLLAESALDDREARLLDRLREDGEMDLGRATAKRYRAACGLVESGLARWGEGALLLPVRGRR